MIFCDRKFLPMRDLIGASIVGLFAMSASAIEVPELDCVIEPHMVIDLSSRTDGIVEKIKVERGDIIQADQVLVELESSVEQAAVEYARVAAAAQADVLASEVSRNFAQRRQGRVASLYRDQAVSSDQLDETETEARLSKLNYQQAKERNRLAQLELRRAQEVLGRHTLRSPIDGVVVQRFLAPGESVEEKPILRLAQINPLRVEVIVPVSYFGAIEIGQVANVMPERPMTGSYRAEVTVVDRVADAASGTFRVRLSLPNPDHKLPSGLNCLVRFLPKPALSAANTTTPPSTTPAESEQLPGSASAEPSTAKIIDDSPSQVYLARVGLTANDVVGRSLPEHVPVEKQPATESTAGGTIPRDLSGLRASTQAPKTVAACQTIGPIDDFARARRLRTALTQGTARASLREETIAAKSGFIVASTQQGDIAGAKALAEQMQAAGLTDMFVFGRGPHTGRVSLGLYNKESWATDRVREVRAAGFTAELLPRSRATTRYWLEVSDSLTNAASRQELPASTRDLLAGVPIAKAECPRTLASVR